MRRSRRTDKSSAQQLLNHNFRTELTTAWKSVAHPNAALRHIENHLEVVPGTGVFWDSVMDPPKDKWSRTVQRRDGCQVDNREPSKHRVQSRQSPEKNCSRSPLRNTTQDRNVCRSNLVEFSEPLVSYRGYTPPEHPSYQTESYSLYSSAHLSFDPVVSQLIFQSDSTDRNPVSTQSSAIESTELHFLNDQPALDSLKKKILSDRMDPRATYRAGYEEDSTPKAQLGVDHTALTPGSLLRGERTPSSSPGSACQRLENLRRHQPDDKLEKLKERIRRQRQHLEEAAEKEKLLGFLEKPIVAAVGTNKAGANNMPTAIVRKVALAPPAPIYRGFNSTETKIQTADGKVWREDDFLNLSRDAYRDLSRQLAESPKSRSREQRADRSKERRSIKPTRKVHRAASSSDLNSKAVISPASWRDGQKLVNMVLGPVPKLPREDDGAHLADGPIRTDTHQHASRDPSKSRSRSTSTERPCSGFQEQPKRHSRTSPMSKTLDQTPTGVKTDLLSAEIQGILDDLQMECKAAENQERSQQRSRGGSSRRGRRGSGLRTPMSTWRTTSATGSSGRACRSASPTAYRADAASVASTGQKKRSYNADTVREYIARQQEDRKRRHVEEKRALRDETERRNQRLQELYRKQREVARTVTVPIDSPVAPVQRRLQETYIKLLQEEAQLGQEDTPTHPASPSIQMRPIYQPSGESDKENKRLDVPHSPSSSDRSFNDQPPLLSRNDLDVGSTSLLLPDRRSPAVQPSPGTSDGAQPPDNDHLLAQLLRIEKEVAASNLKHMQQAAMAPDNRSPSKMSRIEVLKATAAALSNRIENEARKIAGSGINYGTATAADMAQPLLGHLHDGAWVGTAVKDNSDREFNVQRNLMNTGHSSPNTPGLSELGNLHAHKGPKEKSSHNHLSSPLTNHGVGTGYTHNTVEGGKLVNGGEEVKVMDNKRSDGKDNQMGIHDSSASSISEGPLLSEGSFSEEEVSPRPSANRLHGAAEYCAGQRGDHKRLSQFQKEAAKCSALRSPFAPQDGSKAAWEELNNGSPLSVINIFTRNLHGHVKVSERSERNSPSAASLHSGNGVGDAAIYEDDFVSSQSSRANGSRRGSRSPSVNNHFDELMRRSPYEKSTGGINSHHSSFHSSVHSPRLSSGSTSGSSPCSKQSSSSRRRGTISDHSDATLVEEQRSLCSPPSEVVSSDSRKRSPDKSEANSAHSSDPSGHQSSMLDKKKSSSAVKSKHASPSGSPDCGSPPGAESFSETVQGGHTGSVAGSGRANSTTGELQYSPAVLQQRVAAELHYLESVEESVRQLGDMERLIGVSMAQQESATLAQMLKANQQRHERDLHELKIKAEREALGTKLQLEENRHRVARAHIELQESLAATQKETLEGFQEAATQMISQQADAARYTADAARHIKEMTELARSQIAGASFVPPVATDSYRLEQRKDTNNSHSPQEQDKSESDGLHNKVSSRRSKPDDSLSSLNSPSQSDSLSFKRPNISRDNSGSHSSPSHISSDHREQPKREAGEGKWRKGEAEGRTQKGIGTPSIEEEVHTGANDSICSDSIPSVMDEKGDSTSIATEYSLKFDESMTEDEIEERSFRSLLPSEAHRRGTMEKKSRPCEESEDDGAHHNAMLVSGAHNLLKSHDSNMAFSGGQDSFSQFTMDMVRQYMKDEEIRLQHQSSLLHLRQRALKEKTRAELAWLEHQKSRLRDKGEDDKMPPIRKKQRGLLIRLQQEEAEIKRLQEANKAARKERQLLLKQQEEIERMRNSTLRLKERLKCGGGEAPPETPVSDSAVSEAVSSNVAHPDGNRSPSPQLSISGSETSSIMQKLKKMRSHMDEKFLTKREQQLMHRRQHAEELLQWKQRLDQEEAEVRRMEKEALAMWDRAAPQEKEDDVLENQKDEISDISHHQSSEPRTDNSVSEEDFSSATPGSSIHTEGFSSQQPGSRSSPKQALVPDSIGSANYTQDFTSGPPSPGRQSIQSATFKGSHSPAASASDGSSRTKMQILTPSWNTTEQPPPQPNDSRMAPRTEPISDQSDIESRIYALKEELRKRKSMACQLKKEQKKRNKERLKAKEASLLKQLETYNNIIKRTKAEMSKESDLITDRPQIQDSAADQSNIKPPSHRSVKSRVLDAERRKGDALKDDYAHPEIDDSRSSSIPEAFSDEDPPTVTPTPKYGSPRGHQSSLDVLGRSSKDNKTQITESGDENIMSDTRSEVHEELEVSSGSEDQRSEHLLELKEEDKQEKLSTSKRDSPPVSEKHRSSQSETTLTNKSHTAGLDVKINGTPMKGSEASSTVADGYHDDFESLVDSSPREQHSSKPGAQTSVPTSEFKDFKKESPDRNSHNDDLEEEIAEELSLQSGSCEPSHHSASLLDLHKQKEDVRPDSKSINSSRSSPLSTIKDEMQSFYIGDRVLVGSVQPGTLRFKGRTSFANGFWAGVELDNSEGSNNGTYDGVVYFECDELHGIFAPPDKITHLLDKLGMYTDATEDEDSFFDDLSDKGEQRGKRDKVVNSETQDNLKSLTPQKDLEYGDNKITEDSLCNNQTSSDLNTQNHKDSNYQLSNGSSGDIILELDNAPTAVLISDVDKTDQEKKKESQREMTTDVAPASMIGEIQEKQDQNKLDKFTDVLFDNFLRDAVKQYTKLKTAKEKKVAAGNQENGELLGASVDHEEEEEWILPKEQKDGLPYFPTAEKEELSSPELCNRPESPVLGASGQEELAKRLVELELSRELLDELGDDQDWFDEDFGLSSRREQQRLKLKQREEEELRIGLGGGLGRSGSTTPMSGLASSPGGEQQVKSPPRPELPLPPKLPEQPAMVVPHSAAEVEKMVYAATKEILESFGQGRGLAVTLSQRPNPKPSQEYLGKEANGKDQEGLSIRSYKKGVFDLTWEILQEIYAEDPNTDQPQWRKVRRVKASYHRVKAPGDVSKVQEFITVEVLKLYGLSKDQNQKTDWQKMLKFGRKKRDRVDHILVQELHEEESQWVNYDEDELYIKMQLADSIIDSLLRDTANTLTNICDTRAAR